MRSNYKKLGRFIKDISIKNKELDVDLLLGVSITKRFIPSIANIVGTDMSKYKIVKRHQFAYGSVTSRNGEKISVALLEEEKCIVSTSYTVFEIVNTEQLDPEYLMMWFRRSEFDRYARYMSHGTVRELFGWEEMCDVELPVPPIGKQREIVREYNVVNDRILLNEQFTQKLEYTAQGIYKQWFVDFEFPITKEYAESIGKPELENKPYKSSGGEMEYCEILDKDIPLSWRIVQLGDIGDVVTGKTPSSTLDGCFGNEILFITPTDYKNYTKCAIGSIRKLSDVGKKALRNKILPPKSLLVTCIGSDMGKVAVNFEPCVTNQQINALLPKAYNQTEFLYYLFDHMYYHLRNIAIGSSTMPMINKSEFEMIEILYPTSGVLSKFEVRVSVFTIKLQQIKRQSDLLKSLRTLLLQKITEA